MSGEMQCDIVYRGKQYYLPIVIANYDAKPTLLGKNWLRQIKLEWGEIFSISIVVACEQAHLFGEFVRDNLGGESCDLRGGKRSEPARGMGRGKVSLHESH